MSGESPIERRMNNCGEFKRERVLLPKNNGLNLKIFETVPPFHDAFHSMDCTKTNNLSFGSIFNTLIYLHIFVFFDDLNVYELLLLSYISYISCLRLTARFTLAITVENINFNIDIVSYNLFEFRIISNYLQKFHR